MPAVEPLPPGLPIATRIVMRSVADLKPYERNARTHSEAQIQQLMASIRQFGFTMPLLTYGEGELTAGHGRLLAAKRLGMKKVPTIDGSWMTPEQRRAYVIADNKLALNAGWDEEILNQELADLDLGGFDLSFIGFSDAELKGFGIGGLGPGGDAPQQQTPPSWAVVVECADEADQVALIARLEAEGRRVKGTVG